MVNSYHTIQSVRGGNGARLIVSFNGLKTIFESQCDCNISNSQFYRIHQDFLSGSKNFSKIIADFALAGVPNYDAELEKIKKGEIFYFFSLNTWSPQLPSKLLNTSLTLEKYSVSSESPSIYRDFKNIFRNEKPRAVVWKLKRLDTIQQNKRAIV